MSKARNTGGRRSECSVSLPAHEMVTFRDVRQARDYPRILEGARLEQLVKYTVAPLCSVLGRGPGSELTIDDVGGPSNMHTLIARGCVVEIEDDVLRRRLAAEAAQYIAVGKRIGESGRYTGLIVGRRRYAPGEPIAESDLEQPARHGRPAIDGRAEMRRLIDAGLVEKIKRRTLRDVRR